jgi:hypothetical protein
VPDLVGLSSVPFGQVAHAHPVVRDIARRWPGYRQTRSHAL